MNPEKLLQNLVQIYSPSGQEKKLTNFILNFCKQNNIPAKLLHGNVVIYFKGKNKNKCIIFNAHMDTIEGSSLERKIFDGKLYGLGASDNKGAIAAMLLLAKSLQNSPLDVWFTFVCNEETDGLGTQNFFEVV